MPSHFEKRPGWQPPRLSDIEQIYCYRYLKILLKRRLRGSVALHGRAGRGWECRRLGVGRLTFPCCDRAGCPNAPLADDVCYRAWNGLTVMKATKESYWYDRAEAFRAMAEQTSDPDSRSIAFDIAADLERLGKAVGELSRRGTK